MISKDLNLVKIKNVYNSIKPYINLTPLLECNKELQKFFEEMKQAGRDKKFDS